MIVILSFTYDFAPQQKCCSIRFIYKKHRLKTGFSFDILSLIGYIRIGCGLMILFKISMDSSQMNAHRLASFEWVVFQYRNRGFGNGKVCIGA
ncbi:hypothetical protein [Saccharicrinis sp. GN24d3]|uniref:hypothetical protein n=1 Tax=Saccharicrinis sp. GN24d3 TaxID=3458416 RepID=UPI0040360DC3